MSNLNPYTRADEGIPKPIKLLAYFLIVAGTFFAAVFNFDPSLTFPGTSISDYSSRFAFSSTAVRVVSSVLALVISVYLNNAKFLAITLVARVVGEWGDVFIALTIGGSMTNIIGLSILGGIELWAALVLFKNIKAHNSR